MNRLTDERTARLPDVRRLRDDGLTQRAIATRLQVSQSTIRRDLQELERQAQRATAQAEVESPVVPTRESPAPSADGASEVARVTSTLPGDSEQRQLTITVDAHLIRDLVTLMDGTGCSPQEAIDCSVHAVADAYRWGIQDGRLSAGRPARIVGVLLSEPDAAEVRQHQQDGSRRTFPLHDATSPATERGGNRRTAQ